MISILQITNKPPWPPVEGGPMAMHAVTEALLSQGFRVKVLSVATPKYPVNSGDVPVDYLSRTGFETQFVDTTVRWQDALRNLFSRKSYHLSRFYSSAFDKRLRELLILEHFDLVILETLYMLPYMAALRDHCSHAPVVLRAHNIEHLIWARLASHERNPLKSIYLRYLARKLKRDELAGVRQVDAIIAITEVDEAWFRSASPDIPCAAIPFGIMADHAPPVQFTGGTLKLFHLGSMNWWPNMEAVDWLLYRLWPECRSRMQGVELHLAGRHMSPKLLQARIDGVTIHGAVDNSRSFVRDHHVMVAPIFSGSGIRIKILEAMASGRAVVTTTIGAEGIECTHGHDIILANDVKEFAEAIQSLHDDPGKVVRIGTNARKLIEERYHPDNLAKKLGAFLKDVLHVRSISYF